MSGRIDQMTKSQFTKVISESMLDSRKKKETVRNEEMNLKMEYNDFLRSYEKEVEAIIKDHLIQLKSKLDETVNKKTKENYLTYSKTRTQIKEDLENSYVSVFNNGNVDMLIEEHIIFS